MSSVNVITRRGEEQYEFIMTDINQNDEKDILIEKVKNDAGTSEGWFPEGRRGLPEGHRMRLLRMKTMSVMKICSNIAGVK